MMRQQNISIQTVVLFSERYGDSISTLRVISPLEHLGITVINGFSKNVVNDGDVQKSDIVILAREFSRNWVEYNKIIRLARELGKPIVLDMDDFLFQLPKEHPDRSTHSYVNALLPLFQAILEVDLITVSSEVLRDYLSSFNKNIAVLPNYLDDQLWSLVSPLIEKDYEGQDEKIVIGYMGTYTHQKDIAEISSIFENLFIRYPSKLQLHFWGVKPPQEIANHPQVFYHALALERYEDFVRFFQFKAKKVDIFVAPLVDNPFNRAKSSIKFLEYTALGVPGVYSNLEPYASIVTHGKTGFLASTLEEWETYLVQLIEYPQLRLSMAQNAQSFLRSDWLLSKNALRWIETYQKFTAGRYANSLDENPYLTLTKKISPQITDAIEYLNQQIIERDQQIIERDQQIIERDQQIIERDQQITALNELANELAAIKSSRSWVIISLVGSLFLKLIPKNSFRYKAFDAFWRSFREIYRNGFVSFFKKARIKFSSVLWRMRRKKIRSRKETLDTYHKIQVVEMPAEFQQHKQSIDIIVCVHNAYDDVKRCLESVEQYTECPYRLVLVDDGSAEQTAEYLKRFAKDREHCVLLRNEEAGGYTRAANKGMKFSSAELLVLLNSDTIVGPEWLDRMAATISIDDKTAIVGPLSNTASWQSIPELEVDGDWASNPLPAGITVEKMSKYVALYSGRLMPEVQLLNGFCLMIKRDLLLDIGYFDEENFGAGYGEEDDFTLRARQAGWKLRIADDVYIYHAQSKSYSNERRLQLYEGAGEKLRNKHGAGIIQDSVRRMHPNRVMAGIRARSAVLDDRVNILEQGKREFSGKRILFILPIIDAGGGGNVVIDEARAMRKMGVEVSIFNLNKYKDGFLKSYPDLDIPLVFGDVASLIYYALQYDALIATANYSVEWLKPVREKYKDKTLAYYVQGFEPLIYQEGTKDFRRAIDSYTAVNDLRIFVKTDWVHNMVLKNTGVESANIGISVNTDLFRPRHSRPLGEYPVVITAMVRPASPYRSPQLTMAVLRQIDKKFGDKVDIRLFGSDDIRDPSLAVPIDFTWSQAGKLTQAQVVNLLSNADIFVDFSEHQAMGLTALEAMACGCAVVVPQNGGAIEFVRNSENGLVVDTNNKDACYNALNLLISNNLLRKNIQMTAIKDVAKYYVEDASYKILKYLCS